MAGELERLLIRVEADTAQLRRALSQADSSVGQFASNTERRFNSMARTVRTALGGVALAQTFRSTVQMADAYTLMENRLAVVAKSSGDLELVQRRLMEIAQETRIGVADTAEMYSRYAFALKDAGKTTNEMLDFTEALQKAVTISGASTTEAAGALRQFGQGLAADALRGQELNSVMEQMPIIADMIATKLGVTTGELRKLAEQGKITREVAFSAIIEGMTELDKKFEQTSPTIGQSVSQMTNALLELGEASGVFDVLTKSAQGWSKIFRTITGEINGTGAAGQKDGKALPPGLGMLGAGVGMQGNIRSPERKASGGLDPWAASIIPPSAEEQLREMREQWEQLRDVQTMALDDLIGDKTETAAAKMAALTASVKEGSIAWSDFADMQREVQAQTERANDAMLSSTTQFLDSMFANNKTAATASALINTYQGITKALSQYPPPYSYAMAAMQAAMGFAQVRAIQSTSKNSSGSGAGSVSAAGAGASASGVASSAAAAPAQDRAYTVRLSSAGDLIGRKGLRELLENIQDMQRDGYRLVVA